MSIYRSELAAAVRDRDMCSLGAVPANLMAAATSPGLGTRRFGSPLTDDAEWKQGLQRLLRLVGLAKEG